MKTRTKVFTGIISLIISIIWGFWIQFRTLQYDGDFIFFVLMATLLIYVFIMKEFLE